MRELITYTEEERESKYNDFIKVWQDTPEFVRHKFLKELNCILCDSCFDKVRETQAQIKADKIAKYGIKENNNEQ